MGFPIPSGLKLDQDLFPHLSETHAMLRTVIALFAAPLILGVPLSSRSSAADEPGSQMAHMVFFTLKDSTPAAKQKMVAACRKYLSGHDGEVYFSAGARAEEMKRDVNDTTRAVG